MSSSLLGKNHVSLATSRVAGTNISCSTRALVCDYCASIGLSRTDCRSGGKIDWFLPSKDELTAMYAVCSFRESGLLVIVRV